MGLCYRWYNGRSDLVADRINSESDQFQKYSQRNVSTDRVYKLGHGCR